MAKTRSVLILNTVHALSEKSKLTLKVILAITSVATEIDYNPPPQLLERHDEESSSNSNEHNHSGSGIDNLLPIGKNRRMNVLVLKVKNESVVNKRSKVIGSKELISLKTNYNDNMLVICLFSLRYLETLGNIITMKIKTRERSK